MIDIRQKGHQLPDIDLLLKKHLVQCGGHHVAFTIFGCTGIGHLIQQL